MKAAWPEDGFALRRNAQLAPRRLRAWLATGATVGAGAGVVAAMAGLHPLAVAGLSASFLTRLAMRWAVSRRATRRALHGRFEGVPPWRRDSAEGTYVRVKGRVVATSTFVSPLCGKAVVMSQSHLVGSLATGLGMPGVRDVLRGVDFDVAVDGVGHLRVVVAEAFLAERDTLAQVSPGIEEEIVADGDPVEVVGVVAYAPDADGERGSSSRELAMRTTLVGSSRRLLVVRHAPG